jgi:enterochelin esterase-like enzyme
MKNRFIPCYGSFALRPYLKHEHTSACGSLTGNIEHHVLDSEIVGERDLVVYLPPGYSEHDNFSYPFALLQDGQNIFDTSTSVFGVEWGADEAAEQLIVEQKMEPVILVAIYNSEHRIGEYTPFPDSQHGGGQASRYRAFLIHEVIPFLESRYTISKRSSDRAIIGSSLGGLLALYLGWTESETFGLVGALSPSLWWGKRGLITGIAGNPPPRFPPKIWLDAGTEESMVDDNQNGVPDLIDDMRTLRAVLCYHGFKEGQNLHYREVEGATHDEKSWSERIGRVFTEFFPKEDAATRHYRH